MGLESLFGGSKKEKTAGDKKLEQESKVGLGIAAAGGALLGGVAYEATHEPSLLPVMGASPAEAHAQTLQENPTIGMNSSDNPPPITISAPQPESPQVVSLDEHPVVEQLGETQHVVKTTDLDPR